MGRDANLDDLKDQTLAGLLRAVRANLNDAAYWLVTADYLEEQGGLLAQIAPSFREQAEIAMKRARP